MPTNTLKTGSANGCRIKDLKGLDVNYTSSLKDSKGRKLSPYVQTLGHIDTPLTRKLTSVHHSVARQDVTHRLDRMSRIKSTLGIKEVNIKREDRM
ncbi:hypothetical protein D9D24_19275 [Escherichia coli]|nr:hypothetical protein [Escherichia coli]